MSASIIVFDAQYTDEIVTNIEKANTLIDEAVSTLKHASSHRGWRCPEVREINNSFETISSKLKRLDRGLSATAHALAKGQERFNMLEARSERQTDKLSENLREQYGFSASVHGKDETTNLPVTEVPKVEDNFIVKAIKGTAKNIIQGLGTVLGTAIGAISNCINKAGEGFLQDVKDALVTPMINIFQASYDCTEAIKKQSWDKMGQSILKIASNSASLLANALTLGHAGNVGGVTDKMAKTMDKVGDIVTYADSANLSIMSAQNLTSQNIEGFEANLNDVVGLVTDVATPLDQTILQGVKGAFDGAKDGATVGRNIATMLCNFLGL